MLIWSAGSATGEGKPVEGSTTREEKWPRRGEKRKQKYVAGLRSKRVSERKSNSRGVFQTGPGEEGLAGGGDLAD